MKRSIVWLRRDLRLGDNVALYEACRRTERVCLAFVVNPPLLADDRMGAPLVAVFFGALAALRSDLRARGSDLAVLRGDFAEQLGTLAARIGAEAVFYNEDYEPEAIVRDREVTAALEMRGLRVHAFLDHVYFGADEIAQNDGSPYRIFTPYKRRWLESRAVARRSPLRSERALVGTLLAPAEIGATEAVPTPEAFGFTPSDAYPKASEASAQEQLADFLDDGAPVERYKTDRNVPATAGTSQLSPQLRAGTIGIRTCVERAFERRDAAVGDVRVNVETWISEIVWRDFYQMILRRFPHVATGPFLEAAARIVWRSPDGDLEAWSHGRTGFPIVDAAMQQLNTCGWMHNRLRMIVASFLTKNLLLDWRLGERYFERHLADADLAQNNGGWQWAASTGLDAAPYLRIFNPVSQSKQFDPDGAFIKAMIPALRSVPSDFIHEPWTMPPLLASSLGIVIGSTYPAPLVDLAASRARALATFKSAFGLATVGRSL